MDDWKEFQAIYPYTINYYYINKFSNQYGIQLWGCSASSNMKIIQVFQNKVLRNIVRAPWYCRDADIHRDLRINTIVEERSLAAEKHKLRFSKHSNRLASRLLQREGVIRRLKRIKPLDLTLRLCNFSI